MNEHIVCYLEAKYSFMEDTRGYLAIKHEYGGYPLNDWRTRFDQIIALQKEIIIAIEKERKG